MPTVQTRSFAAGQRRVVLCATASLVVLGGVLSPSARAQSTTPPPPASPVAAPAGTPATPRPGTPIATQETSSPAPGADAATEVVVPDDYRVDTGDVLQVDVMRHGDVSRTIRLYTDGLVRLPRLDKPIMARGKTCAELSEEITEKLQKQGKLRLVPNAVTVSVAEMRMHRVYIRGNAGKNSEFDLKNNWRVSEAVAVMGGVTTPERTTVYIRNAKRPAPVKVNLANALNEPDSADNVYLQEGDTITIDLPNQKRFTVKGEGPRGQHEIDERLGLRQALIQLGFTTNGAAGDLKKARLYRHEVPSDPTTDEVSQPVDLLTLMSDDKSPDIVLKDNDTLDIPVSQNFIQIWGETSAPHKYLLPQDRPTYLSDVIGLGGTSAKAKIDGIQVYRPGEFVDKEGKPKPREYKFGKFLSKGDASQNPEIKPGDIVYVPAVNRPDVIGSIWQSWGLFGIIQAVVPGARLR